MNHGNVKLPESRPEWSLSWACLVCYAREDRWFCHQSPSSEFLSGLKVMILCRANITYPGLLIGGILIGSTWVMANTASAQQKWDAYFPQPVHVAHVGGLSELGSEERTDDRAKEDAISSKTSSRRNAAQRNSPTLARPMDGSIDRASHVEPASSVLQSIDQDGRWVEMPQSDWEPDARWTAVPGNAVTTPYVPAPPHRVIQSPRPAPQPTPGHTTAVVPSTHHAQGQTWLGYQETPGQTSVGYQNHSPTGVSGSASGAVPGLHHHLPDMPGVENDPHSVGPGHLGMGTHWLKTRPQPRQTIPGATVAPSWKTPYSYGYFGSEGKRHWTRQHGYRDRYLQWTLR